MCDQDTGSLGTTVSSGLQVPGELGHCRARTTPLWCIFIPLLLVLLCKLSLPVVGFVYAFFTNICLYSSVRFFFAMKLTVA